MNFRRFIPAQLEPKDEYKTNLNYCFGAWEGNVRSRLIGFGVTANESKISDLHSVTIFSVIPMIFDQLVASDDRLARLKELGVTLSVTIDNQPQRSGIVDRGFCLEVPEHSDCARKTIICCWFDDKNPGIMARHADAISTHIHNGHKIKWVRDSPAPMTFLAKVNNFQANDKRSNILFDRGLTTLQS
jgi:hypothetical protein